MPAYGVHDFREIVCKMCKDVLWVCWISKQFQSAKNINQQIQPTVAPLNNQIIEYHYITIIVKCVRCVSSQRYLFPTKSGKTVTTQNDNSRFLFFLCSASCSFLAIPSSLILAYSLLELKLINMLSNESYSCHYLSYVIKGTFNFTIFNRLSPVFNAVIHWRHYLFQTVQFVRHECPHCMDSRLHSRVMPGKILVLVRNKK